MWWWLLITTSHIATTSAYDNGLGRLPPMGWNTWCTGDVCGLIDKCNENLIKSIADAMVEQGMDKIGYEYVLMDDCWSAATRDASGQLQPDADRFPSGMKALADYVHSKGLKVGVYTCVGTKTCRGGLPGSNGQFEKDAATLAGWTLDFVKADFCYAQAPARELYANFSRALNATGRPILFSLCEWGQEDVQTWGADVGQMYRIQMDHLPLWHYPKTKAAAGQGTGQGTWDIIEYIATLRPSTFVKPYGWMDPDFLETLFPVSTTETESRTEMTFWALWSAPLIVSTDVRNMTQKKSDILMNPEVIAIDQDPLGTAGDRIFNDTQSGAQVWAKPLANGDFAVVLYNDERFFDDANVSITWDQVPGFPETHKAQKVRDLWSKQDTETDGNGIWRKLKPRDVAFFRVTPA